MSGLSLHEYRATQDIRVRDLPFYALIAAAMWQADSINVELLRDAFPDVWRDLQARYNAPGGVLAHEVAAAAGVSSEPTP